MGRETLGDAKTLVSVCEKVGIVKKVQAQKHLFAIQYVEMEYLWVKNLVMMAFLEMS